MTELKPALTAVFESMREELDEHRDAINANMGETQSNFEFLCEIDRKVDRLAERLDALAKAVQQLKPDAAVDLFEPVYDVKPLTGREKEVFLALYALTETMPFVTYAQLSRRLATGEDSVANFIASLHAKGVPVVKKYHNKVAYVSFDSKFRQAQAKNNILKLDIPLSHWA